MQVFLTGGTGFIGTALVRSLIDDGHRCTVVSRSGIDPWRSDQVTVVTADPRISNRLASLFPQPDRFEPERWVAPATTRANTGSRCPVAGTALRLPRGAWFPGGTGNHGCPGLPLAELCGRIFLVRWMQAIKGWQPADGAAAVVPYSLIPIRIPTDDYRLGVEPVD